VGYGHFAQNAHGNIVIADTARVNHDPLQAAPDSSGFAAGKTRLQHDKDAHEPANRHTQIVHFINPASARAAGPGTKDRRNRTFSRTRRRDLCAFLKRPDGAGNLRAEAPQELIALLCRELPGSQCGHTQSLSIVRRFGHGKMTNV
jgi:hypothetical protein